LLSLTVEELEQLDYESKVWICSTHGDGSKAEDWRKVTCQIRSGELLVENPAEGRVHHLPLSQCSVDKVAGRITETWHHTRMHIEGFNADASFHVKHNAVGVHGDVNGVRQSILLTALDLHECDGVPSEKEYIVPRRYDWMRMLFQVALEADILWTRQLYYRQLHSTPSRDARRVPTQLATSQTTQQPLRQVPKTDSWLKRWTTRSLACSAGIISRLAGHTLTC
jgi:hypothetical protein